MMQHVMNAYMIGALQEMEEKMCGRPLLVTITQASPFERRFTASERMAQCNIKVSNIK